MVIKKLPEEFYIMGFLKIVRDKIKKIPTILSNRGFTFIEVLVALTILIVIVFAFTPLLVGSINRIHFAGDKSEALYEGQSEMEVDIAERRTIDGYELVFTYGDNEDTEIVVPGGLVDVEKTKGDASAWLRGLVPFVPTINLYPSLIIEGHETPLKMSVLGRETDFELAKSNNRRFIIYDRHGNKVEEQLITSVSNLEDDVYDQEAEFNITKNLTNYGSPYIISLTWEIEDEIEVTTRGRLKVKLPYALAVGEGQRIWISPNARETWREKTQITGTGQ
ncbi:MAG: prepilin-type N-terminal cleavage/methylation domain-containing protein, partial [Candidatus Syntrophonatronum acetioxidans]